MASETGLLGVMAMGKVWLHPACAGGIGLLKRSELHSRKQRQTGRIALGCHLLLCRCFHFAS
ncbi:hypothetical protein [Massilia sp. TWP1-3-3]|uniref:hypothetical protein n=1 Tax=Massilia sp. TWP1-3-3 TaxID=2804573 RepID=UPI003CF4C3C3